MADILFSFLVIGSEMSSVDEDISITDEFSRDAGIIECREKLLSVGYTPYGNEQLKFVHKDGGVFIEGMAYKQDEISTPNLTFII